MNSAEIINYINQKLLSIQQQGTIIGDAFEESKPSQADKPSAHSSLSQGLLSRMAGRCIEEAKKSGKKLSTSYVANTNSMEPFIDDNCIVLLEDSPAGTKFYPGDIVVYNNGGTLIIHTLKDKTTFLGEPAWIIQGYNNFLPDGKIPEKLIVKRYVGHFVGVPNREND
jgi:hypothetical protein